MLALCIRVSHPKRPAGSAVSREEACPLNPLAFIARFIGVTARVGATVALAALILWIGRSTRVGFFVKLDPVIFQSIVVAGIVGACGVVVEVGRNIWLLTSASLPLYLEHRNSKRAALKNMAALTREQADVLRFLKAKNTRRFRASNYNRLLTEMIRACLLTVDDPNWSLYLIDTYYIVPEYVWKLIDERLKNHPVPAHAPWEPRYL